MLNRFSWHSFDLRTFLPSGWQDRVLNIARSSAVAKTLLPRSVTSREDDPNLRIPVLTVNGTVVRETLAWLYELYHGTFCDLAQSMSSESVSTAKNDLHGAVLNIQRGTNMRYESHVDSNPIEGLLYVTSHPQGSGGELVVANSTSATSMSAIEEDASIVYPAVGHLIFFDARRFAHYVRPLKDREAMRVVVAMNFFTTSCSESDRPPDLDDHLFGYDHELDE